MTLDSLSLFLYQGTAFPFLQNTAKPTPSRKPSLINLLQPPSSQRPPSLVVRSKGPKARPPGLGPRTAISQLGHWGKSHDSVFLLCLC